MSDVILPHTSFTDNLFLYVMETTRVRDMNVSLLTQGTVQVQIRCIFRHQVPDVHASTETGVG